MGVEIPPGRGYEKMDYSKVEKFIKKKTTKIMRLLLEEFLKKKLKLLKTNLMSIFQRVINGF